ncbi:MAG: glutamine-hydrolyzing GMP synthase [Clostridiales bacterium]|nr:glutamine-hydrolyzing GMP synthase [Clostridiales bacterium]
MEKVAILDCGGQYTKVIDRKVRELGVYTDIFPLGVDIDKIRPYQAIIFSGGPSSVWAAGAPAYDPAIFDLDKPMLGICYGMHLINEHFGGVVKPEVKTEYGQLEIDVDTSCPLFDGLDSKEAVLMSHGDAVSVFAPGFTTVASTEGVCAGIYNPDKNIVAVQFHPEVEPTVNGQKMLENFLRKMCGLTEVYALEDRIQTSIDMIRKRVGDNKVLVLVSGGVDSAVTAALLLKALSPDKVYAIHIDHGLMRKNESDIICENLVDLGLIHLKRVNAMDAFFYDKIDCDGDGVEIGPLSETIDPEVKRKIIGSMFIKVTRDAALSFGIDRFEDTFLAQGTLRPDLIESGNPDVSGYAHKIKTHHNDVDIVRKARERGMIIETNWDWHKDEVRQVARMLGLDESIAARQPFPGPGLGVRLICCDGPEPERSESQKQAVSDYVQRIGEGRYSIEMGPVRSVGVQGDNRSYKTLSCLYGPQDLKQVCWPEVMKVAKGIPNEFSFINRVAYALDGPAEGTITCEGLHISPETADLLREIDAIVTGNLLNKKIAQCFAVLFPMSKSEGKKYSCAIRAVCTNDFMTARSAVPGEDFAIEALEKTVEEIKAAVGDSISHIFYDVTGKPPATVEWE